MDRLTTIAPGRLQWGRGVREWYELAAEETLHCIRAYLISTWQMGSLRQDALIISRTGSQTSKDPLREEENMVRDAM